MRRVRYAQWVLMLAAWLALVGLGLRPALGQEHYRLQDQTGWQKQPEPAPNTPAGQIQTIRKAMAEGRFTDAYNLADAWIKAHPNNPLLVEAYLLRGDAQSGYHDYYNALYDYEYVIRAYPGSEQFNTALQREFQIARLYSHGVRRKFLGMPIITCYSEAEEILIRIQERAPGSQIGERASLELGEHYLRMGEIHNAATAFDMFLVNYPHSPRREYVMLRLIQTDLAIFKGPQFDATGLLNAAERIKMYQKEYPASAQKMDATGILNRIDESLARREYLTAQWYAQTGEKVSAIYMYRRVVRDHPRSTAARDALAVLNRLHLPVQDPDWAAAPAATRPSLQIKLPETLPANGAPAGQGGGEP